MCRLFCYLMEKNTRKKRYEMSYWSKSNKDLYGQNFTVVYTV